MLNDSKSQTLVRQDARNAVDDQCAGELLRDKLSHVLFLVTRSDVYSQMPPDSAEKMYKEIGALFRALEDLHESE